MFEVVKARESAVTACVGQIRGAILRGELFPKERLPAERKLAETFGVNRMTLRTALTQLAAAGLLEVKQGSGYRVRDYRRSGGPDLLPGLATIAREGGDLGAVAADLLLMRRHMARAVFERIALNGRAQDAQRIAEEITRFGDVVRSGGDVNAIADADMAVLAAILDATGSPVLGLCLNPVLAVLAELPELRAAMYAAPETNVAAYALLSAWLTAPDASALEVLFAELARRDENTIAQLRRKS